MGREDRFDVSQPSDAGDAEPEIQVRRVTETHSAESDSLEHLAPEEGTGAYRHVETA